MIYLLEAISVILMFGFLIFFHELGHLLVAKKFGVYCPEFAIGMGPKLFSRQFGETLYTIRLLPIGGFVRMASDEDFALFERGKSVGVLTDKEGRITQFIFNEDKFETHTVIIESIDIKNLTGVFVEDGQTITYPIVRNALIQYKKSEVLLVEVHRQFQTKTKWQRIAIIFAGPFMNLLLAALLFAVLAYQQGIPSNSAMLGKVVPGYPEASAGLKTGDKIVSIEGIPVHSFNEIGIAIQKTTANHIHVVVNRNTQTLTIPVSPVLDHSVKRIGVEPQLDKSLGSSLKFGGIATYKMCEIMLDGLRQLVTGHASMKDLAGPVGIVKASYDIANQNTYQFIQWAALISINLAVMNLLPIPALDGGRLFFILIEVIRRKPMDRKKETTAQFVGFAFMILLMLVVTYFDISHLFHT